MTNFEKTMLLSNTAPPLAKSRTTRTATTEEIVKRITVAITEHRLPPGTKLGEEVLGEIFGVSRTKVRQALFQLAKDKLVTLQHSRGAFVTQPTVREAREIFEARRILERAVIAQFIRTATEQDIKRLNAHVVRERDAIAANDVRAGTKLSGEFHILIVDMVGNSVLADLLRELIARTSLIILLYKSSLPAACPADEHSALLMHIENGDIAAAELTMAQHLEHIENSLSLRESGPAVIDLVSALAYL